jgi:methyltransferase (TIGR00027 family)
MQAGSPSRTAYAAAAHRAAHQVLEKGRIFSDPLALRILGEEAEEAVREASADPSRRRMRMFIAVRTRFAEDALSEALQRGVYQIVVLGAGLDTYAYRSAPGPAVRIFEVDHPATQAWKRRRLADESIPVPDTLTFAPIDFESQTLGDCLAAAGFDRTKQTFFTWLGVVPYLTEDAFWSTLGFIAGLPTGAHVVFDYSDPPESFSPELRMDHDRRAAQVAALGEAWVNYLEPETLHARLAALGFAEIEDLAPPQIVSRYFPGRSGSRSERGGHVLRASTLRPGA